MDEEFARAVDDGLKLSKRVYGGKDRQPAAPPRPAGGMERSAPSLLPASPMMYAVIGDPAIVDNPDIPSYQPHVYGRCDPPALIPLHMKDVALDVDCYVDTAVVALSGRWRLHCVMASRSCDCRLVVPMGEPGPILGVEVEVSGRKLFTQMIKRDGDENTERVAKDGGRSFLRPQLFSLTIPEVTGGCDISLKLSWSQKLLYKHGQFSISIPFNFPEYVTPSAKIFVKHEKIQLKVNNTTGKEVVCQKTSHPLKEKGHNVEKLAFLYEAAVEYWSSNDFYFSYSVCTNDLFGGIVIQSPPLGDYDRSGMFCLYLLPGNKLSRKVFRKEVVFVVDTSGSMQGKPLENVKNALSAALLELTPADHFNIIAFNEGTYLFSQSLESASEVILESATQWISKKFVAEGGTNIANSLNEALHLLSNTRDALPHIYLITDGAVEDERGICDTVRAYIAQNKSNSPRLFTFGIGSFCNHYFLRMLASIGRGQYDAAYTSDSIEDRLLGWIRKAWSPLVANLAIDISGLDSVEVYPSNIPDLSAGCPLVISGRYQGKFPDSLKAKGILADTSDIVLDLKVHNMEDIALEKVVAKQQIDLLTAEAWFNQSKQLEEKVAKLSIQSGIPSEYTYMVLLRSESGKQAAVKQTKKSGQNKHASTDSVRAVVQSTAVGFGDVTATAENLPSASGEPKPPETNRAFTAAVGCCNSLCNCCCCVCCIRVCSKLNDQFVIAITQLCAALACLGCAECCSQLCCGDSE